MKHMLMFLLGCLAWAGPMGPLPARPADDDKPRKEWKDLTPEQRQARLREWRRRNLEPLYSREEIEARRKELRGLPPEERRAKIREWREKTGGFRVRLESQLAELRQKQSEGTLTADETKRLERLEVLAKRFEQAGRRPARAVDTPR